jgi:predicted flavoprotein YhiN
LTLSFGRRSVRGEALITRTGLEGGGIYALSAALRGAIAACGEATLLIDLRPDDTSAVLERKLGAPRGKQSLSTFLRKTLSLSPAAIALLQEAAIASTTRLSELGPAALAALIKAVPVRLVGAAPIARAISTAGGVAFDEVDEHFMLRRCPGTFVAGEMLDWEAPTGGYLMQAALRLARHCAGSTAVARALRRSPLTRQARVVGRRTLVISLRRRGCGRLLRRSARSRPP